MIESRLTGVLSPDPAHGAYQHFSVAPAVTSSKIPGSTSFAEAAVLPVAFDTALIGLCSEEGKGLGLPLPSLSQAEHVSDSTVVIWGGSSSVGSMATQLATAAGVRVISIASKHNFDFCRSCGASEVFSYKEADVVENIVGAVKEAGGTFGGIFDCVSMAEQSFEPCQAIIKALGGGTLAVVLPRGPEAVEEGVKVTQVWGMGPLTHPFWNDYINTALKTGQLKCLPAPVVVGQGLESLQTGIDRSRKGASAQKFVVEL